VAEESKPRGAIASIGIRVIVFIKYAPDDVFIDHDTKGIGNLLGNSRAAEAWIPAFYLDDGLNEFFGRSFGAGVTAPARGIE
jgi:hypothetical protein